MPDFAPLVIAVLSLVATVTLGVALCGRRDLSSPRCRRCNADVREKAMDGSFTCVCGAELLKRRAVRFPYRLRRRWATVGLVFALAAFGLGVVETHVLSIGLGWHAVIPNWLFNLTWPYGEGSEHDSALLKRRVESLESCDEARALLAAVLARPGPARPWDGSFARLIAAAAPSGDLAARAREELASTISYWRIGTSVDLSINPHESEDHENAFVVVRIDEVAVNGVSVPFEVDQTPLKVPRGVWREVSTTGPVVILRDPIATPPDTTSDPVVEVSGEMVYVPFPPMGWWEEDGECTNDSDPSEWGLDHLRFEFSATERAVWSGRSLASGPLPTSGADGRLAPVLGYAVGAAIPPWLAVLRPIACAVVGTAFGLAFLAGIGLVRLATVSRWTLNVAACPRCRSYLRGPGITLPARCPECGAKAEPHAVRYGVRVVIRSLLIVGGAGIALALGASVVLRGAQLVERVEEHFVKASFDPIAYATWHAERTLADEEIFEFWVDSGPSDSLPFTREKAFGFRDLERIDSAFARAIANGWRDAERKRSRLGHSPSMEERWSWFKVIDDAIARESLDAPEVGLDATLVAARDSMREAWGLPGIAVPRAVRVGERIVPRILASHGSALQGLRVREHRPTRASPGWTRPPDSPLRVATDVGTVSYGLEWALRATDEPSTEANAADLCGTIRGTVRVLPNDGPVTVVTDPALNPLDGGATFTLDIRETGERDLVTITADDAAVGVALAGSWRLGGAGEVTAPRVVEGEPVPRGPWTGLVSVAAWTGDATAGAIDGRPDEVVATFVPDRNAGPIEFDQIGTVTILWGAETTVRFRRVPERRFDVITRYELVP